MAYASVSQAEHDPVAAADTPSPTLPRVSANRPLSMEFDSLSGAVAVVDKEKDSPAVGNLLKSITSAAPSYEMLDDDDYEEPMPALGRDVVSNNHEEPRPVRTASVSRHLPLNHPVPDLQSLQGAYLKNVERLEESAERLSITSSLDDEALRANADQQRLERRSSAASSNSSRNGLRNRVMSSTSLSNSIVGVNNTARSGGYSPSAYITSPTGSIRSGPRGVERRVSRSSRLGPQLPEPEREGRPLDMVLEPSPLSPQSRSASGELTTKQLASADASAADRPESATSGDTFQQIDTAFADFDGTHYSIDRDGSIRRQLPLHHPPRARDSRAFREAQPGEQMIYYPAPVPVMLNLPSRLSKANFSQQQQRRLQAMSTIPDDMRKSAPWLVGEDSPASETNTKLRLPPQLRASAFFDQQSASPNLQLKNGSAVQTLDSILDAAAHAPVSAFTDHPIVGRLGKEVYGREKTARKSSQIDVETAKKRRSSLSNILKSRKSSDKLSHGRVTSRESKLMEHDGAVSGDELEAAGERSIAPGADELPTPHGPPEGEEDDGHSEGAESDLEPGFSGAPTTLLAELQLRKAQQKQRNRTAADAFPNGMHSTLLELDAVTQLQQRSRKQKHVTLAWEDHDAADKENYDDEDVPLGVLFPEKERSGHVNYHRPIGLMERREMEDNEPLSHRRARLRGEPYQPPQTVTPPRSDHGAEEESKFKVDLPGMTDAPAEEQEGETLAQRRQRMKEEKEKVSAGNFASDVASQLGLDTAVKEIAQSKTPDAEETLGQRRQRLKEEASRPGLKSQYSMADLLQHNPVGARGSQSGMLPRLQTFGPAATQQRGSFMPSVPAHMATLPYYNHSPYMNAGMNASQPIMYGGVPQMAGHPYASMIPDPSGPPLNTQQRAVIDRWREGIK